MHRFALVALATIASGCSSDLWLTADQRGRLAFEDGRFGDAAEAFADAEWRGVALYRAKRFDEAAEAFGRTRTAEGAFGRGNALVFTGDYEDAIESYDRALELRPSWGPAIANREIARVRLERLARPEDDAGGTGGKLEADEIVFDDRASEAKAEEQVVGAGDEMSDEELRALWLRRVETKPADFLRSKFAYQLARREGGEE
jgi:Ca-activated chloride channel family protein